MTTARHIVALPRIHIEGDEDRFLSVATQLAAHKARQGHGKLDQKLLEAARDKRTAAGIQRMGGSSGPGEADQAFRHPE